MLSFYGLYQEMPLNHAGQPLRGVITAMVTPLDRELRLDYPGLERLIEHLITGGVHGRNRMMGNSLLDCAVFGWRAGHAAADAAR